MHSIPAYRPSISWRALRRALSGCMRGVRSGSSALHQGFEKAFAEYIGVSHAVSVPSARVGLFCILRQLDIPPGSEIIIPGFTFWVIPEVVAAAGFKPVYADIDPATCNMAPSSVRDRITPRTAAILPTHLFGLPCPMEPLAEIARKHRVCVIEDCVQACGAPSGRGRAGSSSDCAYFSFGITKNISMLGGGMVTTNDNRTAEGIRRMRDGYANAGISGILRSIMSASLMKLCTGQHAYSLFVHPAIRVLSFFVPGILERVFSEKEEGLQACISRARLVPGAVQNVLGPIQLGRLDGFIAARRGIARLYFEGLRNAHGITLPSDSSDNVFTSFPIRTGDPGLLARALSGSGIGTSRGFMKALGPDCPEAAGLEARILHLPIYPSMTREEANSVIDAVRDAI